MCFNKEMTLAFSILGCIFGAWVYSGQGMWNTDKWRRVRISACFFWFAFMEFLQFVEYLFIDRCDNIHNQIWTALGWIHITFQPFFSNVAFSALDRRNVNREKTRNDTWTFIIRYSFVAGVLMTLRLIIPVVYEKQPWFGMCDASIEGVCGPRTCSTTGLYHVKWDFKMLKPLYPFPGINLHFLNMFVAPALMGLTMGSIILFITGPLLAAFFPVRDGERSSIWCFFSIGESFITVFTQYLAIRNAEKKLEKKK
ncbi:hypothetical protein M9Y10_043629 [Tritrichomonas musculus]|uniref:Uncharacterized protein n=1 Tax=Tritrichomonas musculus TaxID=1915356 RepID=A0ABR2K079_9EUKA